MKLGARVLLALGAFVVACGLDLLLARLWTALCVHSCTFGSSVVLMAYNVLMPIAVASVTAWVSARPNALRRARPSGLALVAITFLLSLFAVLARGHAHGG